MRYCTGEQAMIGDRVLWAGRPARVVFCADRGEFPAEFPRDEWQSLGAGIMLQVEGVGLVHQQGDGDPDIEFLHRAK